MPDKERRDLRRKKRRKQRRKNIWGFFLRVFILALIIYGANYFLHSSFFYLEKVEVKVEQRVSQEEVLSALELPYGTNIFSLDIETMEDTVEVLPFVRETNIKKKLPGSLIIEVTEREPVAYVVEGNLFIEVDRYGVLLQPKEDIFNAKTEPMIAGIELPGEIVFGTELASENLFNGLKIVEQLEPSMIDEIEEINVSNSQKLRIFLTNGIEIRLGTAEKIEIKIEEARLILANNDQLSKEKIAYIDVSMSSRPVIYYDDK